MSARPSEKKPKKRRATWPFSRFTYDRLWMLHAWMGVVGGVVLHLIFFTGVFALFREEIAVWEDPMRGRPAPDPAPDFGAMRSERPQAE